jgi:hypothetical protein
MASGGAKRDPCRFSQQQGDINGARQNLQASLEILTSLIRLHGENATWKMDLDLVKKELGDQVGAKWK